MKAFLPKALFAGMFIAFVLCLSVIGCSKKDSSPENADTPTDKLSVGINKTIKCSAVILAKDLGIFDKNALDVKILEHSSGSDALKSLYSGKVNIATAPEHLIAFDSIKRSDSKILAVINRNETQELVARRDCGINEVNDLKEKIIGIKKRSSSIYWLSKLLLHNGLSLEDVSLEDATPERLVEMLSERTVDAIITWHPYTYKARTKLVENAYAVKAQLDQDMHWVLVAMSKWLDGNPDVIIRFLKAIQEANNFIKSNPERAKIIVSKYFNIEKPFVESEWPLHTFQLELPQNLIIAMEQVARWKLAQMKEDVIIPNYLGCIYFNAMEETQPKAISIVH